MRGQSQPLRVCVGIYTDTARLSRPDPAANEGQIGENQFNETELAELSSEGPGDTGDVCGVSEL